MKCTHGATVGQLDEEALFYLRARGIGHEQARADSQPQLEIYADDVKCTHGATLGPLDAKELFYLQSRGLDPEQARGLLLYGFGAEILGRIRHAGVRDALDHLVQGALQPALHAGATL